MKTTIDISDLTEAVDKIMIDRALDHAAKLQYRGMQPKAFAGVSEKKFQKMSMDQAAELFWKYICEGDLQTAPDTRTTRSR